MSITIDSRGDFIVTPPPQTSPRLNTSALTHEWVAAEITDAQAMLAPDHGIHLRTRLAPPQLWAIGLILCPLTALAVAALVWGKTPIAVAIPVLAAFAAYLFAALTVWPYRPQRKRWVMLATFAAENDAAMTLTAGGKPSAGSLSNRTFHGPLRLAGFESTFGRPVEAFTASGWTIVTIPVTSAIPHFAVSAKYNETTLHLRRALPRFQVAESVPFDRSAEADETRFSRLVEFERSHTLTVERGGEPTPELPMSAETILSPTVSTSATRALDVVSGGLLELLADHAPDFDVECVDGVVIFNAPVRINLAEAPFWRLVGRFVSAVEAIERQPIHQNDDHQRGIEPDHRSPLMRERFSGTVTARATTPALHVRERWWIVRSVPLLGSAAVLSLIYAKISTLP
ncbi:hypothetical protein [Lysinibacter cavernae]|uniref:Uncharacterized protein n=1 Tax=Lysinibacter cavernae TaxID=1640652 RepID=A0A7X5R2G2_9MICO|nr:hypothetical protein [Lysinibacter cavernae]NIH54364.1 hypothetical protein [Lysinibacter cavernae]